MSMHETARQILLEQKSQKGSWEKVAQYLSEEFGEPISVAAVWKMANGKSR